MCIWRKRLTSNNHMYYWLESGVHIKFILLTIHCKIEMSVLFHILSRMMLIFSWIHIFCKFYNIYILFFFLWWLLNLECLGINCLLHDLGRHERGHEQLRRPTFCHQIAVWWFLYWQCKSSHTKQPALYQQVLVYLLLPVLNILKNQKSEFREMKNAT